MSQHHRPQAEPPDLAERGANDQRSDRRLFVQFHAWGDCDDTAGVIELLLRTGLPAVLYEDLNDPFGIGLALYSEEPTDFVGEFRRVLQSDPLRALTPKPELTMFGRTYSLGYEPDLDETLIERPRRTLRHDDWRWAVWYPLRRKGGFAQLDADEQRSILMEHGKIGMGFGAADLGHDLRLACHGLDRDDNDFVIGLFGERLAPLSKLVETMRRTEQTSTWLERLGPFFVGRKAWHADD